MKTLIRLSSNELELKIRGAEIRAEREEEEIQRRALTRIYLWRRDDGDDA